MKFCGQCGASVQGARFCGQCGAPVDSGLGRGLDKDDFNEKLQGLEENQLAALAYLTPLPALGFLVFDPYRRIALVRFHSYQCLFLTLAAVILMWLTGIISAIRLLEGVLSAALQVVALGAWALAAYKAWRGQEYRLPVIGAFAARQARQ